MRMNGLVQGIAGPGRDLGGIGMRVAEHGGGLDSLEIALLVLGLVLWAAVMTSLVMFMIGQVRSLRRPRSEDDGKDKKAKDKKKSKS